MLVIDNGCDQTTININYFLFQPFDRFHYNVGRVLNIMNPSLLELANEAFSLATLPDNSKTIFQINQVFLDRDPLQSENLL